ncbi:MAG: single-stranded DNA-binding protein [Peptoniphilus sp.]|nr:single-stranded DNA-binding protein [Peptoniphilus sp.]MDY3118200.1 single-stranded DNA-binding protein [Peptoniphilus sp.]
MNVVILYGRLTRDPELRYSPSGVASCFANVAVNRAMRKEKREEAEANGQPTADFIGVKAFGKTAEILAKYFKKGSRIALEGRIATGSYEKDGKKIYTTDVMVSRLHFVESAGEGGGNASQGYNQGFAPQDGNAGYYPVDNNDVPF